MAFSHARTLSFKVPPFLFRFQSPTSGRDSTHQAAFAEQNNEEKMDLGVVLQTLGTIVSNHLQKRRLVTVKIGLQITLDQGLYSQTV